MATTVFLTSDPFDSSSGFILLHVIDAIDQFLADELEVSCLVARQTEGAYQQGLT